MAGRRRLIAGTAIDALGSGLYLPFTLLFFTQTTTHPVSEIGVCLTVAGALSVAVVPIGGRWIDRFGLRAIILASNGIRCVAFALYPVVGSLWAIVVVMTVVSAADALYWSAHSGFVATVADADQRARWYGLDRMLRNAGYGVGGLASAVLLLLSGSGHSHVGLIVVVLLNAGSYLVAMLTLLTWRPAGDASGPGERPSRDKGGYRAVIRDRAFMVFSLTQIIFVFAVLALPLLMPLYVVDGLHQALWIPGALMFGNTVLTMTQSVVVRFFERARRTSALQLGAAAWVASFVVFALAWLGVPSLTVALLVIAVTLSTVAELVASVASTPLLVAMAPDHLRGRYLSVNQLGWSAVKVIAPAAMTGALAVQPILPWLLLAAACAVSLFLLQRLNDVLPDTMLSDARPSGPIPDRTGGQ